ncbi:MAG: PepSY domain-containing protein [Hyphomicrobiales bacterium]
MSQALSGGATQGAATAKSTVNKGLYATIWRWHFYAALYVLPFMFMLSLTGLVYLYQKPIENILYKDAINVEVGITTQTFEKQAEAITTKYPKANIRNFVPPASATKSTIFDFKTQDSVRMIGFVNPYTAEILLAHERDGTIMRLLRKFHGELLMGRFGTKFVELAGSWAIVLMITGLYMWWPRNGQGVKGTLIPRKGLKGRPWWKEWHTIIGFLAFLLITPILLTGLPWTDVAGGAIKSVQTALGQSSNRALSSAKSSKSVVIENQQPILASHVIMIAEQNGVLKPYSISFPKDEKAAFLIASRNANPLNRNSLHIDQYSGAVLKDVSVSDNPMMAKVISSGIALHQGKLFGTFNLVLATLAALLGMALAVSGFYAWWRRKPTGKLGTPRKAKNFKIGVGLWVIIAICAIIMPLMGASLILMVLLDKFFLSKKKRS